MYSLKHVQAPGDTNLIPNSFVVRRAERVMRKITHGVCVQETLGHQFDYLGPVPSEEASGWPSAAFILKGTAFPQSICCLLTLRIRCSAEIIGADEPDPRPDLCDNHTCSDCELLDPLLVVSLKVLPESNAGFKRAWEILPTLWQHFSRYKNSSDLGLIIAAYYSIDTLRPSRILSDLPKYHRKIVGRLNGKEKGAGK